jgi:phage head maturation protease
MAAGVRNLSVGFRPIKATPIDTGGLRFERQELIELSVVAVPALPGAKILGLDAGPDDEMLAPDRPAELVSTEQFAEVEAYLALRSRLLAR